MVETISPVVYGERRRYPVALGIHTAAATVSAGLVGALLGALGAALGDPWSGPGPWILATVAVVYAARELLRLPIPLPNRKAQVPSWWRTFYGPHVAAGLYGFGLGPGFLTYLGFGTYAAVLTGALLSGDPLLGALIAAPFGLARGLIVAVGGRATGEDDPAVLVHRLMRLGDRRRFAVAHGVILLAIAAVALL